MLEVGLNSMSGIHKRDASRVISQVSYNSLGRYVTLNFIRDKWEEMNKAYVDCNTRSTPKTLFICLFLYTVSSRFPVCRISPKSVTISFNTDVELKAVRTSLLLFALTDFVIIVVLIQLTRRISGRICWPTRRVPINSRSTGPRTISTGWDKITKKVVNWLQRTNL